MLPVTPEQLKRAAHDVHVFWDEAQSNPALLRFLAPFGRPELGRLSRAFERATSVEEITTESHPAFGTWLAALLAREHRDVPPMRVKGLGEPQWDSRLLVPSMEFTAPMMLSTSVADPAANDTTGRSRITSLIVAGSVKAPAVVVTGASLVIAGDLDTEVLIADGCVLIGGTVRAKVVVNPAEHIGRDSTLRAVGWQVGQSVECTVFDSPRFALTCPVKAEVVLRAPNLMPTPEGIDRAGQLLAAGLLAPPTLSRSALLSRVRRGESVLR
ncbi:MAG: hypothetical protein JNM17_10395 [Archangium sp.]|nr:hypothetical protein [Archangium sp.]